MVTEPFFSIIIPALNEEKYLPLLLVDLQKQSFQNFEVVVVDGNSIDKTVEKAQEFKKILPSLTILTSKIRNVSVQRNMGAKNAHGKYLLFNDADNRLDSLFLAKLKVQISRYHPNIFSVFMEDEGLTPTQSLAISAINTYTALQQNSRSPYVVEALLGINRQDFTNLQGFNHLLPVSEGTDLLRRAKRNGLTFKVFRHPRYRFSLRRLTKEGLVKMASNIAKIEMSRFFGKNLSHKDAQKLYPMSGGNYYNQPK